LLVYNSLLHRGPLSVADCKPSTEDERKDVLLEGLPRHLMERFNFHSLQYKFALDFAAMMAKSMLDDGS